MHVVGVDIDQDALETAWVNLKKNEIDEVDLVNCDVRNVSFARGLSLATYCFLTVIRFVKDLIL